MKNKHKLKEIGEQLSDELLKTGASKSATDAFESFEDEMLKLMLYFQNMNC